MDQTERDELALEIIDLLDEGTDMIEDVFNILESLQRDYVHNLIIKARRG